ncbi:MAG TPA: hypothetical protein VNW94_01965 [Streptosporangiaceae bacterium]|jgi:hypothetical protein|nr:hypothetical protein [Streptosporangiaceae bacterium]
MFVFTLHRVKDENTLNGNPLALTRYVLEVESRGPAISRETKVNFRHFVDGPNDVTAVGVQCPQLGELDEPVGLDQRVAHLVIM